MLIVVMGMSRSGTSLLMQVLQAAGFDCGSDWIPANRNNERGYLERKSVMQFNMHLLETASGERHTLFPMPYRQAIEELVGEAVPVRFPDHDYAVKDPRFSLTFPVWYPSLQDKDVRIVLARREDDAIAESMLRAYGIPMLHSKALTREYLHRARTYIERYRIPFAELWYETWSREPEANVKLLEKLIGRSLEIGVHDLVDTQLTHCAPEKDTIRLHDLAPGRGAVSLSQIESNERKENFYALRKKYETLADTLEECLQQDSTLLQCNDDENVSVLTTSKDGSKQPIGTIPKDYPNTPALQNLYRQYNPKRQWLILLGIDAVNPNSIDWQGEHGLSPIVLIEPDRELFLAHCTVHSYFSLFQQGQFYLFCGDDAFESFLQAIGDTLEPYFISCDSLCLIPGSRFVPNRQPALQAFFQQLQQRFRKKMAELKTLMDRCEEKYRHPSPIPPRNVMLAVPNITCWKVFAEGWSKGLDAIGCGVETHVVSFPPSSISAYDSLSMMLSLYRNPPDYLLSISHSSDLFFQGMNRIPIRRLVWYIDEPDHLIQHAHNPNDFVFYAWDELHRRLLSRGGHAVGEVPIGGFPAIAEPRDSLQCDVGFVGSVQDTGLIRHRIPPSILEKVDTLVSRKLQDIKCPIDRLLSELDFEWEEKNVLLRLLDPLERKPGMDDLQLLTYFFHLECIRKRRVELLSALREFDVKIFGPSDWAVALQGSGVESCFQHRMLDEQECRDFYRSAKISLNIHPPYLHNGPIPRDYDIPMCDGFVLSDMHLHAGERTKDYFEPGREIALYSNSEELADRVHYYLEHPDERGEIIANAKRRIQSSHSYAQRVQLMFDRLQQYNQKPEDEVS